MEQQSKIYLRVVGIMFFVMFLGIMIMNYFLNPYFVFGVSENDFLLHYKDTAGSRKGKSELLNQQSSRYLS